MIRKIVNEYKNIGTKNILLDIIYDIENQSKT